MSRTHKKATARQRRDLLNALEAITEEHGGRYVGLRVIGTLYPLTRVELTRLMPLGAPVPDDLEVRTVMGVAVEIRNLFS